MRPGSRSRSHHASLPTSGSPSPHAEPPPMPPAPPAPQPKPMDVDVDVEPIPFNQAPSTQPISYSQAVQQPTYSQSTDSFSSVNKAMRPPLPRPALVKPKQRTNSIVRAFDTVFTDCDQGWSRGRTGSSGDEQNGKNSSSSSSSNGQEFSGSDETAGRGSLMNESVGSFSASSMDSANRRHVRLNSLNS